MTQDELKQLAQPIVDTLRCNGNPYCAIVITTDTIRLVSTEIGIPVTETAAP